ncbi:MAG: PepSY-associated TM helix domain-containing protein [Acidobacteriota bacterium]
MLFQIHLWVGAGVGLYVVLMSVTGSVIVFRDELSKWLSVEWLVDLHENLLLGECGRAVNGTGAICVMIVCLTGAIRWWPGLQNWRRSLTVTWGTRFARFNWDTHSALGFWCFFFILMWGISGIYLSFPQAFNVPASLVDPGDKYADRILFVLANLHFGRFG